MVDCIINLDEMDLDGTIECPYCSKGKTYSYGAKGKQSMPCGACHRMVLWDYDMMKAYKAKVKKYEK